LFQLNNRNFGQAALIRPKNSPNAKIKGGWPLISLILNSFLYTVNCAQMLQLFGVAKLLGSGIRLETTSSAFARVWITKKRANPRVIFALHYPISLFLSPNSSNRVQRK